MKKLNVANKLMKLRKALRARGVGGVIAAGVRYMNPPQAKTLRICKELVAEKRGLEIGGPSPTFSRKGSVPLYPVIGALDNCTFGNETVWEGALSEGENFQFDPARHKGHKGRQFIAEAIDLCRISDCSYDFVLSCHSIEHSANPICALKEWMRVLKDNGGLILIVPHKEETFDHRRPITTLQHLIDDFQKNMGEDDLTHAAEAGELYDLDRYWWRLDREALKQRFAENFRIRRIHHHVFNTPLVVDMVNYAGLQILSVEAILPFHIIVTARKLPAGQPPQNEPFLSPTAEWRRTTPFKLDR